MEKSNLDRINELSRISRERKLTEEEEKERKLLRENYLKAFRSSFRIQLDNTVIQRPDGSKTPLKHK